MNFEYVEKIVALEKLRAAMFFADRSIPLADRWAAFESAPDYMKNDMGTMCSELDRFFGENVVMYDGMVHAERYSRHSTTDVVENIEEHYADMEELDPFEHIPLETIKEKILAENFGFFEYDW